MYTRYPWVAKRLDGKINITNVYTCSVVHVHVHVYQDLVHDPVIVWHHTTCN